MSEICIENKRNSDVCYRRFWEKFIKIQRQIEALVLRGEVNAAETPGVEVEKLVTKYLEDWHREDA